MPADALPGLLFKPFVEINGFLDQPAELVGEGVNRDQPSRMPCGTRSQLRPLNKAYIGPAPVCQAVKDVGADTSASDDNDPCM